MMASDVISSDEIAQYDRQIRLWGLDAQKRLRRSNVLVVGLGGLGSEVVKNIVLAGIHSITLLDWREVTEEDLYSQLLITPFHLGENVATASAPRARELNPNVIVNVDVENIREKSKDFYSKFDVVCLTRCDHELRERVDEICREKTIKFFCGDVYGFFGYFFSDLGSHEYVVEIPVKEIGTDDGVPPKKPKVIEQTTMTVKKRLEYCSYKTSMLENLSLRTRKELKHSSQVFFIIKILDFFLFQYKRLPSPSDADELQLIKSKILSKCSMKESFVNEDFATHCLSILSPIAAIVAGVLGQEIIKAITMKDKPHKNFFFFDGCNHTGVVDDISPKLS